MARDLTGATVVITGASSGIGRATALAFARAGANVVLAARREDALRTAAAECEALGARALVVPTDVRDADAVERLATAAVGFGSSIDVWVNNAAVGLFGRFMEAPPDLWREVIEVNVFGVVNGSRAAVERFLRQGHGTLINVGSVNSKVAFPFMSSYMASKHAVRGFGESLRQELRGSGVDVCTVLPSSVDTPFFQHGANWSGRAAKAIRPMVRPERVARAIVRCARRPRRELVVGASGRATILAHALAPGLLERVATPVIAREMFYGAPIDPTAGNVREPMADWTGVTGGWKDGDASPGGSGPAEGARWAGLVTATGAAAAAAMLAALARR